ncbi:MAG: endolytic transglycosylase MltG [Bacteroidetes bacterium]|nr:MAG: endolytic transglycosylase MltG [Bacteroidota bacterium]
MTYYHSKYGTVRKKKRPRWVKFVLWFLFLMIIASIVSGYYLYQFVFSNNVWTPEGEAVSVYIPSDADYEDVKQILYSNGVILNRTSFEWLAERKKYPELVKPGRFMIMEGMSNDKLINMLRLGEQSPLMVIFNNIRTKEQLAKKVSEQIEADSVSIMALLNDSAYQASMGLNTETALSLFVPNTYEFYWNTDARQFMDRMHREYLSFWEGSRNEKAASLDMSWPEVVTLASIVDKETNKNDEKATIAGVYMNRLDRNWLLQADPTLVYASGDFGLTRVLNIHKEIDSPYNTYKYSGLPPGPICIPSISSIDAVLNKEDHDYLFFCAKDDLSGYHAFARSITQHNRNARKYRKAIENR